MGNPHVGFCERLDRTNLGTSCCFVLQLSYPRTHQPGFVVKTRALEGMAAAFNDPLVRRTVTRLLDSALAGRSVAKQRADDATQTRPV